MLLKNPILFFLLNFYMICMCFATICNVKDLILIDKIGHSAYTIFRSRPLLQCLLLLDKQLK